MILLWEAKETISSNMQSGSALCTYDVHAQRKIKSQVGFAVRHVFPTIAPDSLFASPEGTWSLYLASCMHYWFPEESNIDIHCLHY